jgi:ribosomal protein S27E
MKLRDITVGFALRPCYVQGRKALFHAWTQRNDGLKDNYVAIIEWEDGVVTYCYPHEVRFIDNKINEYVFDYQFATSPINWKHSDKPTRHIKFICKDCGKASVFLAERSDGKKCVSCGSGLLMPEGFVER